MKVFLLTVDDNCDCVQSVYADPKDALEAVKKIEKEDPDYEFCEPKVGNHPGFRYFNFSKCGYRTVTITTLELL